jgi:hypothetical protein
MTSERARWMALAAYLLGLAIVIALLFVKKNFQPSYDLSGNAENLIALYAVPLSIIVTGISSRQKESASTTVTGTALLLLFGSTLLWNALVVGTLAYYDWATMTAKPGQTVRFTDKDAADFLNTVPSKLSFLISAALTYFFVGTVAKSGYDATGAPPAGGGPVAPVAPGVTR